MTLSEHLNDSVEKQENVNESLILGALVATACLSFVANGFFNSKFMESVGGGLGGLLGGIGSLFGLGSKKEDPKKEDPKKEDPKKEDPNKNTSTENDPDALKKSCLGLMAIAEQANKNVKDETEKKKNESLLNLLSACTFDKDGNQIPFEERMNKMKDIVGEENWDSFKKDMEDTYNKHKDSDEFKKALENAKNTMKTEDAEAFVKSAKEKAKATLEQVAKEKAEQAELDAEIEKLKEKVANNMVTNDDEEKLRGMLEKRKMLVQNSVVGQASPATAQSVVTDPKQVIPPSKEDMDKAQKEEDDTKKAYEDAKKEVDDLTKSLEGKDKDSQEYKDIKKSIDEKSGALEDLKKKADDAKKANDDLKAKKAKAENGGREPGGQQGQGGSGETTTGKKKPEDYTDDDIKAVQDEIKAMDSELDKDEIKAKQDLLKSVATAKGKSEDEYTKNINPKQGKKPADYTLKELEDMQKEIAELDPVKDKDKIDKKNKALKTIATAKGKNPDDLVVKNETTSSGKVIQKRVGPQDGKYYRVKGENGWGEWVNYQKDSELPESLSICKTLKNFLLEKLFG